VSINGNTVHQGAGMAFSDPGNKAIAVGSGSFAQAQFGTGNTALAISTGVWPRSLGAAKPSPTWGLRLAGNDPTTTQID
jgi:hypothetical protein